MTFSVDTNIVIGVINPKDRLHTRAVSLVNTESGKRPLVPLITVVNETKSTFARKYIKAASLIFAALRKSKKESLRDDEYGRKTVESVNHLIEIYPEIKGFIKLIYDEQIKESLPQRDLESAFKNVSSKGLEYLSAIEDTLKKEANNNTEYLVSTDTEYLTTQKQIQDMVKGIYYKDENDRLIFLEAVTYSQITDKDLDHYTDDNECIKQSELSLKQIKTDPKYKNNKLKIKKLP